MIIDVRFCRILGYYDDLGKLGIKENSYATSSSLPSVPKSLFSDQRTGALSATKYYITAQGKTKCSGVECSPYKNGNRWGENSGIHYPDTDTRPGGRQGQTQRGVTCRFRSNGRTSRGICSIICEYFDRVIFTEYSVKTNSSLASRTSDNSILYRYSMFAQPWELVRSPRMNGIWPI